MAFEICRLALTSRDRSNRLINSPLNGGLCSNVQEQSILTLQNLREKVRHASKRNRTLYHAHDDCSFIISTFPDLVLP